MPSAHVVRTYVPVKLSPAWLRKAAIAPDGKKRKPEDMEWLHRFCETGDATGSAAVAFGLANKHEAARIKGWALMRSFSQVLPGLMMERRGFLEPKALAVLERAMERAGEDYVYVNRETGEETRDPPENWRAQVRYINGLNRKGDAVEGIEVPVWEQVNLKDASPQAFMAAVKAAGEVLDRGGMPRGMALHGLATQPEDGGGKNDARSLLDAMVDRMGVDAVRRLPVISERKDFREYLDSKYGRLKVVGGGGD